MTEEHWPTLIDDHWLCRLLEWRLPWIVEPTRWGAQLCIVLWRDA